MMPIPKSCLNKINVLDITDYKYRNMLIMQMEWINKNELRIKNRARNLYYLILHKNTTDKLLERCCDFVLLERKCNEFMVKHSLSEEEILYCYFSA